MSIEETFIFNTAEESVTSKDWAAGSIISENYNEFVIKSLSSKLVSTYTKTKYAPALYKIFDETIVNALDHVVRTREPAHVGQVCTEIKITFDRNGRITVTNNGAGVPTPVHKLASEKLNTEVRVPTMVFGMLFQGSSTVRHPQSIIGGTNGLGAKLANLFSTEFSVETVDTNNIYFFQKWTRGIDKKNEVVGTPIIKDMNVSHDVPRHSQHQHTTVSFVPNYVGIFKYEKFDDGVYDELVDVFRTRVVYAAAYAGVRAKVYFNNDLLHINSINDVAKILYPGKKIIKTRIAPEYDESKLTTDPNAKTKIYAKLPWDVSIIIDGKLNSSIVNGCVVPTGTHINRIFNVLNKELCEKLKKDIGEAKIKSIVESHIAVMIDAKVPSPSWGGQRKDNLTTNSKRFDSYKLDDSVINEVSKLLKDLILSEIDVPKEKKKKIAPYDKIIHATNARKAKNNCSLLLVEGDSAMDQLRVGLSEVLGNEDYGIMSLGGVIMNVRKQSEEISNSKGTFWKQSAQLSKNKFIMHFMNEVGLNINYKYDITSKSYEKEYNELKYKKLVVCVDQDLDGKGHILGLFLSLMEYWWPNLINNGFVAWFETPIIRAYPKSPGLVQDFYSTYVYAEWAKTVNTSRYHIKYYKGLATHEREEVISMFECYYDHLFTYSLDSKSSEMFDIYFGKSSDARKKELSTPAVEIPKEIRLQQERTHIIMCSDHLLYETKPYDQDNVDRKLPSAIDGQNQAGRIIVNGALKALASSREIKTAQIANEIAGSENYHHGESGLALSVSGRCFITTGGYQLPLIRGTGNHGSRANSTPGATRYTHVISNSRLTDLVLPRSLYYLLDFTFDEGKRGPPKFFVPVVPLAVLESTCMPATGWKIETWARDYKHVIANVRRLIRLGVNASMLPMSPATYAGAPYEWKGEIRYARGIPYSVGKYQVDGNKVTITELPLRVWTNNYLEDLNKLVADENSLIDRVDDQCGDINVKIIITLNEGAKSKIESMADDHWFDGYEEYFKLRLAMHDHINMLGPNKEVIMMDSYEDPIRLWFPYCKKLHGEELDRARKLCEMEIRMLNNIIRYIEENDKLCIAKKKSAIQIKILEDNKFEKCASSLIANPQFIKTDQLEQVIFGSSDDSETSASYNYLLNITDGKKSDESLDEYKKRIDELNAKIVSIDKEINHPLFPGAGVWLDRLEKIEKVVEYGTKTFWKYEEANKYTRTKSSNKGESTKVAKVAKATRTTKSTKSTKNTKTVKS